MRTSRTPRVTDIDLPQGTYNLSLLRTGDDLGYVGDLDITDDVSMRSIDGIATISAAGLGDRVIHIHPGTQVSLDHLEVTGAVLTGWGAGILNEGSLSLSHCVVTGNTASSYSGGGIYTAAGTILFVLRSTVTFNSAEAGGGGLYVSTSSGTAVVAITNSTVSGNSTLGAGGGVYLGDPATLDHVTLAENVAGLGSALAGPAAITLTSSVIVGDCSANITSTGSNVGSPGTGCALDQPSDRPDEPDPGLRPLAGYGGPTMTHALLETGPARSLAFGCPQTDQRGAPRWVSMPVFGDAGAFEYGAQAPGRWIFSDGVEAATTDAWSAVSP